MSEWPPPIDEDLTSEVSLSDDATEEHIETKLAAYTEAAKKARTTEAELQKEWPRWKQFLQPMEYAVPRCHISHARCEALTYENKAKNTRRHFFGIDPTNESDEEDEEPSQDEFFDTEACPAPRSMDDTADTRHPPSGVHVFSNRGLHSGQESTQEYDAVSPSTQIPDPWNHHFGFDDSDLLPSETDDLTATNWETVPRGFEDLANAGFSFGFTVLAKSGSGS